MIPPRLLLLLPLLAWLVAACGLGDVPGASLAVGRAIDDSTRDLRITRPVAGPVRPREPLWLRVELEEPSEGTDLMVRLEKRVGGSHQQRDEIRRQEIPPWTVAAVPFSLPELGEWSVGVFVNQRKVADIDITVER